MWVYRRSEHEQPGSYWKRFTDNKNISTKILQSVSNKKMKRVVTKFCRARPFRSSDVPQLSSLFQVLDPRNFPFKMFARMEVPKLSLTTCPPWTAGFSPDTVDLRSFFAEANNRVSTGTHAPRRRALRVQHAERRAISSSEFVPPIASRPLTSSAWRVCVVVEDDGEMMSKVNLWANSHSPRSPAASCSNAELPIGDGKQLMK